MMGIRLLVLGAVVLAAACGPKVIGSGEPDAPTEVPVCDPGATELCYNGPVGTEGVGPCRGGTRTCSVIGQWGPCDGEIVPAGEACANGVDENCNGMIDEDQDLDGDGFTTCGGDCCDSTNDGCASPTLVNPGAFEAAGNNLDDDCDGIADNVLAVNCDGALPNGTSTANDYAHAMDICQDATTTSWGLVSSQLLRADGTGTPLPQQHAVRPSFGATVTQSGAAFTVLSTGNAATPSQTNPGYLNFQTSGEVINTSSPFPADFLAAHGGTLPNTPGCPALLAGSVARDPVMLQLQVRAPTNAKSFSFSMNFMSSEYPEWTCSPFNDFFVVLLDSAFAGTPANPADKNLAFYANGANVYPVGVNLAFGNTGLFTVCKNGVTGCTGGPNGGVDGAITTCVSDAELVGTGMDQVNPPANPGATGNPGSCGTNNLLGGGTGWLTTSGNIVGGETFTLRIALWDTSDGLYDSVALIDNFQWSVEASEPGTVLQKPKKH